MNLKTFKLVCKVASFLLKVLGFFAFITLPFALIIVILPGVRSSITLDVESSGLILFRSGLIEESHRQLTALIVAPIFSSILGYTLWKGSQLFDQLIEGYSPFSIDFRTTLKRISLLLIGMDILLPLVYSLVLSIILEDGYYFVFGIGSLFLVGLILYAVAEIFQYGIELQQLTEDTV